MKKGKIAVIAVILVLLAGAAYFIIAGSNSGVAVKVFKAARENITASVSATGVVQEKGHSNIYVNTPVRVEKINVKNGDRVKKGDVLASLDVEGLKIQYEQARISYNIDKINLENLKKNQNVKDTINEESAVSSALFELEHKQLAYDEAKREYDENLKLYDTGAVSMSDLNKCEKRLNEAEVDLNGTTVLLENAKKSLNSAKRDSSNSQGDIMAQIDMQSEKLLISELKIKEMIENLKDVDIETGKVIASSDGMIASIGIKEGDYTVASQAAISIVDIDELIVNAKITESNIKQVKLGNKVVISGDSIEPESYEGVVTSIAPVAKKEVVDKTEQTVVSVEIQVTNKDTLLKPGFNVDLKIETKSLDNVLAVSGDAVKEDKDGKKFVYVVNGGKARKVDIDVAIESETSVGLVEQTDGIAVDSKVIYNSSASIDEGVPVKIIQEK